MNGVYEVEVRKTDLLPYHRAASELARTFEYFNIEHVPREQNTKADALASLAASMSLPEEENPRRLRSMRKESCHHSTPMK